MAVRIWPDFSSSFNNRFSQQNDVRHSSNNHSKLRPILQGFLETTYLWYCSGDAIRIYILLYDLPSSGASRNASSLCYQRCYWVLQPGHHTKNMVLLWSVWMIQIWALPQRLKFWVPMEKLTVPSCAVCRCIIQKEPLSGERTQLSQKVLSLGMDSANLLIRDNLKQSFL